MIKRPILWVVALAFACVPAISWAADPPGLVTVPSKYSVEDTIRRFEEAVTAAGWMVLPAWIMRLLLKSTNKSCSHERSSSTAIPAWEPPTW